MDGLLVIDKPVGPTSHDVVARARQILRERAIGHTGTLDPMASGVLPLVVGRATRLARFVSAGDKHYTAVVRLGVSTDTYDALGTATSDLAKGPWPDRAAIDDALNAFRGTFLQQPPAYSAKKIDGTRSYRLARRASESASPLLPPPVAVTATSLVVAGTDADRVTLEIACSSGFYVRSLAHDLGQALGVGAHLAELRRTATCGVTLAGAVTLAALVAEGGETLARAALIPMDRMLTTLPSVGLTDRGTVWARSGRELGPEETMAGLPPASGAPGPLRLLDPAGRLVAIAERRQASGLLHPAVVLM